MSKRCEKYFGVFLPALIAFVPAVQAVLLHRPVSN